MKEREFEFFMNRNANILQNALAKRATCPGRKIMLSLNRSKMKKINKYLNNLNVSFCNFIAIRKLLLIL